MHSTCTLYYWYICTMNSSGPLLSLVSIEDRLFFPKFSPERDLFHTHTRDTLFSGSDRRGDHNSKSVQVVIMSMRLGSRRALSGLDDMNNTSMSHIPEDTTLDGGFRHGRSSSSRFSRPLQDMNHHSYPKLYRKTSNTKRSHPNLRMSIVDPTEDGVIEPTAKDKYAKVRCA